MTLRLQPSSTNTCRTISSGGHFRHIHSHRILPDVLGIYVYSEYIRGKAVQKSLSSQYRLRPSTVSIRWPAKSANQSVPSSFLAPEDLCLSPNRIRRILRNAARGKSYCLRCKIFRFRFSLHCAPREAVVHQVGDLFSLDLGASDHRQVAALL